MFNLQVVELALELFPKEGPDIFLDMLVYVVKSVLEDKVDTLFYFSTVYRNIGIVSYHIDFVLIP